MIELDDLVVAYRTVRGEVTSVAGVNLQIPHGQIIGIAGESGCGKSTLLKVLYGDITFPLILKSGEVRYGLLDNDGTVLITDNIRDYWFKRISYIPQNSMGSLNPVKRIRHQLVDFAGRDVNKDDLLGQVQAFMRHLDLPPQVIDAFPHQLSGGMKQRVIIAMATFFQPDIILADEPTTALDVVVQKGILLTLARLQEEMQNTLIIVSHDMGVHYQITHKVLIMYAAKAVEFADTESIFSSPLHPYTRMLIESLPAIGDDRTRRGIEGSPPSLWDDLRGCRFAPRCPLAEDICRREEPPLKEYKPGHLAACHFAVNGL
ncbi:MAG: ABC transporter ATP-binding protein [Anaerolineae bacterium]